MEDRMDYGQKNQVMIINDIGNSEAGKNGNQFQDKEKQLLAKICQETTYKR